MCFLKDNFLGPPGNLSPPPPLPRPLPSLRVQAEWGGDTQVQIGIFQLPSPQAELQAAEPGMQPMQPVQGEWRSSERPRAAPSAVSGRGRAQGVGDVVTTARREDSEHSAWSCGLYRVWVRRVARRDDSCHTGLTAPPSGATSTNLLTLLPCF